MKTIELIPFGAQYYRAPTPKADCWEKDLENIKKSGFNTIKIWSQWRWGNPAEGEFYFDDLQSIMDIAHKNNLEVIINIIMDVAPAWLYRKHPDVLMETADGTKLKPMATPYRQIGGAPGPCFHHAGANNLKKDFIRELVRTFKDHPALSIWDIWNEPELTVGIKRIPTMDNIVCYCDHSHRAFIRWLEEKYSTLDKLNSVWGRNYRNWEEIEIPNELAGSNFGDMVDWRSFFIDTITADAAVRMDLVKEQDKEHPVMIHTVPMPYFNIITSGSDDYNLAKLCDMHGNSVGSDPFAAAISDSAARGKKVISAEIHAIGGNTFDRPEIPTFEEIKRHIMVPLARGIKGFQFWQYRPETLGAESPAWGLTNLHGEKTPWLDYAVKINNALQENKEIIAYAKVAKSKIAVINGPKNEIFDWCMDKSVDRHYKSIYGTFMALYDSGYDTDVISTDHIIEQDLSNYSVIFYPFPYYVEEKVAVKLKKWIKQGGTLIGEVFFAAMGDDGFHSTEIPGKGFQKVFKVKEENVLTASKFKNAYDESWAEKNSANSVPINLAANLEYIAREETVDGFFFQESFSLSGAEVIASFSDGTTAISKAEYGEGQAIMIGSLLGYQYAEKKDMKLRNLIASLAVIGGVKPYCTSSDKHLRVDLLNNNNDYMLVVINNNDKSGKFEIIIEEELPKEKAINILTHKEWIIKSDNGISKIEIQLEAAGCDTFILK